MICCCSSGKYRWVPKRAVMRRCQRQEQKTISLKRGAPWWRLLPATSTTSHTLCGNQSTGSLWRKLTSRSAESNYWIECGPHIWYWGNRVKVIHLDALIRLPKPEDHWARLLRMLLLKATVETQPYVQQLLFLYTRRCLSMPVPFWNQRPAMKSQLQTGPPLSPPASAWHQWRSQFLDGSPRQLGQGLDRSPKPPQLLGNEIEPIPKENEYVADSHVWYLAGTENGLVIIV